MLYSQNLNAHLPGEERVQGKIIEFSHIGQNSDGFLIVGVTETVGLMFHMLRSVWEETEY